MLWRLLWSFSRGVRSFGEGAASLSRPRPVAPVQPHEGEPKCAKKRHQQHKAGGYGNLSHLYSPLDAFTWSTLAVLTLELVKQVRWLSSLQAGGRDAGIHQLEGPLAVLSQHQHSVPSSCCNGKEEQQFFIGAHSGCELKNPSSSKRSQPNEYELPSDTGNFLFAPSTDLEPDSCQLHLQGNVAEEVSIKDAASEMEQVIQTSISMAFNILGVRTGALFLFQNDSHGGEVQSEHFLARSGYPGLEYMQDGQHKMAFSCFKLAADQNYSKAQFNVAICYEHGRGTKKDIAKAVLYYQRAAHQGHTMAQYRYARWLLRCWPCADNNENMKEPVGLLDQTATPGRAQNSLRRRHLAAGCENGLRIQRRHYQQADAASYKTTQKRKKEEEIAGMQSWHRLPQAVRTFSSSPCLQSLDQPVFDLFRSWSTGSLRDIASGSVSCMHSPVFSDGLTLKLQSLGWSPGAVIS